MKDIRLGNAVFTIFDVETTGLYPYSGDRICEIAAIQATYGGRAKKFHSLIDPGRPVSYGAFKVNGITEDMLKGKPKIDEVLPQFIEFIEGSVLVAYNAFFDLGFIEYALGQNKKILENYRVIDALSLARRLFPYRTGYSLANVAASLGISSAGHHRAMADSVMTWKVFRKELEILLADGAGTVTDIAEFQARRAPAQTVVKDYKYKLIEEAIRAQKSLNITYRSIWDNGVSRRLITPKEIQRGYKNSYVIAHCHLKNAERNFRLDGILEVTPQK